MTSLTSACALTLTMGLAGCQSTPEPGPATHTGFLSTYSRLEQVGESHWRYIDPSNRLARYDKFIIHPVKVLVQEGARGEGTTTESQYTAVADYMRQAVIDAIEPRYDAVDTPRGDVADVYIAITDAYYLDNRVGLAMEGEVIDSVSSVQIGAVVRSVVNPGISLNTPAVEARAKEFMDEWARNFRTFLDRAHE